MQIIVLGGAFDPMQEEALRIRAMRYYFHFRLQGELLPDREGLELSDIAEAQAEAKKFARELSDDLILDVGSAEANAVEVAGSAGNTLFSVLMCGPIQPVSI